MKLKARDIIPGWPRGRSTQAQHGWLSTESYNWHLPLRVNRVEGAYVAEIARGERGVFARACEDEARLFAEARENSAYHAAQAEMVEEWRANSGLITYRGISRDAWGWGWPTSPGGLFINPSMWWECESDRLLAMTGWRLSDG